MLKFLLRLEEGQRSVEEAIFSTFTISSENAMIKDMAIQTKTYAEQTDAWGKLHNLLPPHIFRG